MLDDKDVHVARQTILQKALLAEGKVAVVTKQNKRMVRIAGIDFDKSFLERKKYLHALDELSDQDFLEYIPSDKNTQNYELTYMGILVASDPNHKFDYVELVDD